MAERSVAYANMRRGLLAYVRQVPPGQVVEVGTLADSLNIPARHAAYMLTRLSADEEDTTPWHRVVPRGGVFSTRGKAARRSAVQIARLREEGVPIDPDGRIQMSPDLAWDPPREHRDTVWAEVGGAEGAG